MINIWTYTWSIIYNDTLSVIELYFAQIKKLNSCSYINFLLFQESFELNVYANMSGKQKEGKENAAFDDDDGFPKMLTRNMTWTE